MVTVFDIARSSSLEEIKLFITNTEKLNGVFKYSAQYGRLDIVKFLVLNGANIHTDCDHAVRWAADQNHLDMVKFLVLNGANIHACYEWALNYAAQNGHLDIVKFLVLNGADIHVIGDRAFTNAAFMGRVDVVKFLVLNGANIRASNDHALKWSRNINVLNFLLSKIVPKECEYSVEADLYKLIPSDHELKKIIDRVIASRALMKQRLHKSLILSDVNIACYD